MDGQDVVSQAPSTRANIISIAFEYQQHQRYFAAALAVDGRGSA